jgi:hypothetical protein
MRDATERNLLQRVQVDEISGSLIRMMKEVCGEILPQLGTKRRDTIEYGSAS